MVAVTFWPSSFDPRSDVIGYLRLVLINAPSGDARFIVGQDGKFIDIDGNNWFGSQLIQSTNLELARQPVAYAGRLEFSYFQDPDAPDLIDEINQSGDDAIGGSKVKFYIQPLFDVADFYNPKAAPILRATRVVAGGLKVLFQGDTVRSISVNIEGPFRSRVSARSMFYNTEDHSKLIGESNPSLSFMPQDSSRQEKLYG